MTGKVSTAENLAVAPDLRHLYAHLVENRFVVFIEKHNVDYLPIFSRDVLARIQTYDPSWETMVPPPIVEIIKREGCSASGSRNRPPTGREHLNPGCWGWLGQFGTSAVRNPDVLGAGGSRRRKGGEAPENA